MHFVRVECLSPVGQGGKWWLSSKKAGVQISPGHTIFFLYFTQRSKGKGRGKGNAKFTRLKSKMASGLQSFFLFRVRVIITPSPSQQSVQAICSFFEGKGNG